MSFWNCVSICTNQFLLPKKGPRKPEIGIKYGFEQIKHDFPFGKLLPGKQTTVSDVP